MTSETTAWFDHILTGDCIQIMRTMPEKSVDLVFADPPYNLQLEKDLWRPNATKVNGVDEPWDQFSTFENYDEFTLSWLQGCRRVLKDRGTIWVIGSYHNIFRVGKILQDLGFWILNDVVWIKNNPMPNFHGVRFTNAHETLIWAQKIKGNRYTFNYQAMKAFTQVGQDGGGVQMRSDWRLPLCTGKERIKVNGEKAHPTQKPEALLERIILSSTRVGDVILDPFFGSGTTGAVAKRLGRHWLGIEIEPGYISIAQNRIDRVEVNLRLTNQSTAEGQQCKKRIPFTSLLENGLLLAGEALYFGPLGDRKGIIEANGQIRYGDTSGSIHKVGREISHAPCNGWMAWYYIDRTTGEREPIDRLRKLLIEDRNYVKSDLKVDCEDP